MLLPANADLRQMATVDSDGTSTLVAVQQGIQT